MKIVKFSELSIGKAFFDYAYSRCWMIKINARAARFSDGLVGGVAADCPVQVDDKTSAYSFA